MRRVFLIVGVLLLAGGPAWADTIYTSLGPGNTWDHGYSASGGYYAFTWATTFQAANSGVLTSLSGPWAGDPGNSYDIELRADNGSGQPGTLLESWALPISST